MSYPKRALIIVFCLSVFLFIYLQHVRSERAQAINQFFDAPKVGDVYKVKFRNSLGERWVRYYKIADMNENTVFFYRGKLVAWGIADVLLDHYETSKLLSYSKDDLNKIRHGKFSNGEMYGAELLEISRQ
jgi:hypothetical protein